MYREFFGLKKRPFILTPDPNFLFVSRVHDFALAHLEYGLMHNAGFIALTGEIGAGKTTVLKYLFNKVRESQDIAMIFNTQLDSHSLLEMIAREFGLTTITSAKSDLIGQLHAHFIEQYSKGRRSVIVVDEAQNLSIDALEELRMLSNLEADNDFLVQIILVGQPQLKTRLTNQALAQLTQRISVYYHLAQLAADEIGRYIEHRLKTAGYAGTDPLFAADAVERIADASKGVPRVINTICETCLTYAFSEDEKQIGSETVRKVIDDNLLFSLASEDNSKDGNGVPVNGSANGTGNGNGHDNGNGKAFSSSADVGMMLSSITSRLADLELRIAKSEQIGTGSALEILEASLAKERERSRQLAEKLTVYTAKYKDLRKELEEARGLLIAKSNAKPRKLWKIWGNYE